MIRTFHVSAWLWRETRAWEPQVDVFETASGFHVVVALPGIRGEQVSLLIDENGLVLRTQREPAPPLGMVRVRRMEIPYGPFERRITLPRGRYVVREQRMVDGCLELLLARETT